MPCSQQYRILVLEGVAMSTTVLEILCCLEVGALVALIAAAEAKERAEELRPVIAEIRSAQPE
jgi:hypothetical protein